jgi:hypothetical protein
MKAAQRREVRRTRGPLQFRRRMFQAFDARSALRVPEYMRERRLLRKEKQEYARGLK